MVPRADDVWETLTVSVVVPVVVAKDTLDGLMTTLVIGMSAIVSVALPDTFSATLVAVIVTCPESCANTAPLAGFDSGAFVADEVVQVMERPD